MVVVAAMPWTYWMAFPLLGAAVLALLVFFVLYLKKVVEPRFLYLEGRQEAPQVADQPVRAAVIPDGVDGMRAPSQATTASTTTRPTHSARRTLEAGAARA